MPGRHVAPRHRASRSLSRSLGRLAVDAVAALPKPHVAGTVAAVGATGVALGIGVLSSGEESVAGRDDSDLAAAQGSDLLAERDGTSTQLSRSGGRPALVEQRAIKAKHLAVDDQQMSGQVTKTVVPTDPREIAQMMLAERGWSDQYSCLDSLYVSESNWDHTATNPYSGAYGIPQSLPAEKMAAAGPDWRTNPATQIEWGLDYIDASYGTPCSAWAFKQANNWY